MGDRGDRPELGRVGRSDRARGGDPDDVHQLLDGGRPMASRGHSGGTIPSQQAIFDGFVIVARWRRIQAKPGETQGRTREYDGRATTRTGRVVRGGGRDPAKRSARSRSDRPRRLDVGAGTRGQAGHRHPGIGALARPEERTDRRSARARPAIHSRSTRSSRRARIPQPMSTRNEPRASTCHVCEVGSDWERRHLAFRDELRKAPRGGGRVRS